MVRKPVQPGKTPLVVSGDAVPGEAHTDALALPGKGEREVYIKMLF